MTTKKNKDPRQEKIRDFRNRGNHPHYGIKKCGSCFRWHMRDKRRERQKERLTLQRCKHQLTQ